MNKCNSSPTRSVPFSATSGVPSCASLGATPVVLSSAPWIISSGVPQTHLSFSRLHFHSYFQFLNGQILHPFAPLSRFLRAFSSAFHTISITSFGGAICGFAVKQIVGCTLKNVYTNAYIIYSAGIALHACIK